MNTSRASASSLLPAVVPAVLAALVLTGLSPGAQAQSFCASDGQAQPAQLMERFINADCASCWVAPDTPKAGASQVVLDWVAPGSKGDDAPLSAVANRDALLRLQALRQPLPAKTQTAVSTVKSMPGSALRVSHGTPVADYVGASIELQPIPKVAKGQQWTAWLALVETLPVGTEGSPTERNLVRNLLQTPFDGRKVLAKDASNRFFEARSMNIPQGAKPERLRVVGWVEDARGQVLAAAQSRCETTN